MSLTTVLKDTVNRALSPLNVKIDSLTAERAVLRSLRTLEATGHFDGPVFPTLPSFTACEPSSLLQDIRDNRSDVDKFNRHTNTDQYCFDNAYFSSPDAEVAYALIRRFKPRRIVEVGSGNSTHLFRAAISDGGLDTELISIDPSPRRSVRSVASRVIESPVEHVPIADIRSWLAADAVLFIDSSHEIRAGNDVVYLFLNLLPLLAAGTLIHIHDIFLPYEYPKDWILDNRWHSFTEQYIVQALLKDSTTYEVIWLGYYLQNTLPNFASHFSAEELRRGASLWLRKRT